MSFKDFLSHRTGFHHPPLLQMTILLLMLFLAHFAKVENCVFLRYSAEEYARKFGSAPAEENLTNDIEDEKPLAKEEGSLLSTVVEIAMKFVPLIIDTLAGSTGPSQTDR